MTFLDPKGFAVAYRAFVRAVCKYGGVGLMGALATHLSKFYKVQKLAESCVFGATSAIGLLCKLLRLWITATFCPILLLIHMG